MLKDVKGSVLSGFVPLMRTGDLKDQISKKKMNRGKKKPLHFLLVGCGEKEESFVAKKKEKAD